MRCQPRRRLAGRLAPAVAALVLAAVAGSSWLGTAAATEPLTVAARVAVGAEPLGIALAHDGQALVVAAEGARLYRIDAGDAPAVTAQLDLSAYGRLNRVAVDPASGMIYVTASVAGIVLAIDPDLSRVRTAIPVGAFPQGVAVSGTRVLVANSAGSTVSVVDPVAGRATLTIDAGDRPMMLAVDTAGGRLVVLKSLTRSLWLFDLADLRPMAQWNDPAFTRPMDLVLALDGSVLMVDGATDQLLHLDGKGGQVLTAIDLDDPGCAACGRFAPTAVALSPDGAIAAVASRNGAISLIDVVAGRLVASRRVGRDLRGIVFAGAHRLLVTSYASAEVIVVDVTPSAP